MPELWRVKSEIYKNKGKKNLAYDKLVQKLKKINSTANTSDVIAKLNSFKSSCRREIRKMRDRNMVWELMRFISPIHGVTRT